MPRWTATALLLTLAVPSTPLLRADDGQPPAAPASAGASAGPVRQFVRDFGADQKAIWTSPFRMNRHQLLTRALPLAAGTAALIAADRHITNALPNTPDQIRWSGYVSNAGAAYTLSAVVAAPLIAGSFDRKGAPLAIGRSSALALADAAVVSTALKFVFSRERPDAIGGNGRFFQGGTSFPSGHAMASWAVCTAIAQNRRSPKWLKVASFAAATAISLSRVSANRHYASDVFVGGMLGGMIGARAAGLSR
jgi:membrane-associated phospholipid phosphatase